MAVDCSAIMKQSPRVPALSSGAFQPHIPYEVSAEMNINSMSWGEAGSQLIRFAHFNLLHQEVSSSTATLLEQAALFIVTPMARGDGQAKNITFLPEVQRFSPVSSRQEHGSVQAGILKPTPTVTHVLQGHTSK